MLSQEKRAALAKKIKALLAKTNERGCTEAEVIEAALKAAELQAAYNIDLTEVELMQEGFDKITFSWNGKRLQFIEDRLVSSVAFFTSTQTWLYRPKLNKRKKADVYKLVFCGFRSDVVFASWLFEALRDFIDRSANFYAATGENPKAYAIRYNSFVLGACENITKRLRASKTKDCVQASSGNALIVLDKTALILKHLEEQGVFFKKSGVTNDTILNKSAYLAGRASGEHAAFNKPINSTGKVELLK